MKKHLFIIFIFLIFLATPNYSQNSRETTSNLRKAYSFGQSIGTFFPLHTSSYHMKAIYSIDYYFLNHFNAEAGLGLRGVYGGLKYHIFGKTNSKLTPYLGLNIGGIQESDGFFEDYDNDIEQFSYRHIGLSLILENQLTFDISYGHLFSTTKSRIEYNCIGFKIGKRFNTASKYVYSKTHYSDFDITNNKEKQSFWAYSDTINTRKNNPIGFNLVFGGVGMLIGLSGDFLVYRNFNLELGIGSGMSLITGLSLYAGTKYYFSHNKNIATKFYIGAYYASVERGYQPSRSDSRYIADVGYFPVGAHYISNNGFSFSIEGAIVMDHRGVLFNKSSIFWPTIGIKFGKYLKIN